MPQPNRRIRLQKKAEELERLRQLAEHFRQMYERESAALLAEMMVEAGLDRHRPDLLRAER
jgi:hypothetical protein